MSDARFIVAYSIVAGTFVLDAGIILLLVFHNPLPAEAYGIVSGILGVWHIGFAGAYGYWIGSSHSSQNKDETINALAKKSMDGTTT